jgi:hypothetical protein
LGNCTACSIVVQTESKERFCQDYSGFAVKCWCQSCSIHTAAQAGKLRAMIRHINTAAGFVHPNPAKNTVVVVQHGRRAVKPAGEGQCVCMARGEMKGQKRNKRSGLYKLIPACYESPTWALPRDAVEQGRSAQLQTHCSRRTRGVARFTTVGLASACCCSVPTSHTLDHKQAGWRACVPISGACMCLPTRTQGSTNGTGLLLLRNGRCKHQGKPSCFCRPWPQQRAYTHNKHLGPTSTTQHGA